LGIFISTEQNILVAVLKWIWFCRYGTR